ncbi:MAG: hypothetical protein ACYC27_08220 [Armatimonadota bacterium]
MSYSTRYTRETAPKLGAVFNSIDVFSSEGKDLEERRFTALFEEMKREGIIHSDSILIPRIFGRHEAMSVADRFAAANMDVILICNSAFPNGHVFPTIALHPHLSSLPLIITADAETELGDREWTTNAWCGVIMNNHLAKQLGRHIRPLAGNPESEDYRDEFRMLMNSYRAVAMLRRGYLGRFGDAPGGFHSATADQTAFLRTFGIAIETVDLLAVMNTYECETAKGSIGTASFTETDVEATMVEMKDGRECVITDDELRKAARLYHALKAQIEANGFTAAAVKCWPEIGITTCFPMTWLLTKEIVTAVGCESDCPTAVIQSLASLLSGKPAACLDFVNYTGRCSCVELGHCGVGIAGQMGEGECIAYKSPDRQAGASAGPALIGQFAYGPKTGIAITQGQDSGFKILCFTGENSPESAKHKLYSAADVIVEQYKQLDKLILKHGFPHHLAVAMDDISREVAEVCDFLGIDCLNPDEVKGA